MSRFMMSKLSDSSLLAVHDMRDQLQLDPSYQRPGGIWNTSNKQLFIDSLFNKFDVPKFYFHYVGDTGGNIEYAIIDGRQRLETIWSFMEDEFRLSKDFVLFDDETVEIAGKKYSEIAKIYPRLITRFSSRTLDIVVVTTDDIEFIEDMFSRLNDAVPLNAAEKRNAFGGPMPRLIRDIVEHPFFTKSLPVSNSRYRHFDIAAKFLHLEAHSGIPDTKKSTLDNFVKQYRESSDAALEPLAEAVTDTLDAMYEAFDVEDELLKSTGAVSVYYVLFSRLRRDGVVAPITRDQLQDFEDVRAHNRSLFSSDVDNVDYDLIAFDEVARSSNDGPSISYRYSVIRSFLGH
ncbi:MAG: DUF262 domain-containing protein [Caulobacter sp.]